MSSAEEYRKRAKEARQQANTCCIALERQGLLIIADQCERIASYKDLTSLVTSPSTKAMGVEARLISAVTSRANISVSDIEAAD
jgi:hypothetical protein